MGKIGLMLVMICSVWAICYGAEPKNPVTNLQLPATAIETGCIVELTGNGFTANSALYLKDDAGKETKLTVQKTSVGVKFTTPATLVAGDYSLILKQDGDWNLGKVAVVPFQKNRVKTITHLMAIPGIGTVKIVTTFSYKENSNQLQTITEKTHGVSFVPSGTKNCGFAYEGDRIAVNGTVFDPAIGKYPVTYYVKSGKVATSESKKMIQRSDASGRPMNPEIKDITCTWNYSGNYLTDLSAEGKVMETQQYKEDNFIAYGSRAEGYTLTYKDRNLKNSADGRIDIPTVIYDRLMCNFNSGEYYAYLLGIAGARSVNLPTEYLIGGYDIGDIKYTWNADHSCVTKVEFVDNDSSLEFTYEPSYKAQ